MRRSAGTTPPRRPAEVLAPAGRSTSNSSVVPPTNSTPSPGVLGNARHAAPEKNLSRLGLALAKCRQIKNRHKRTSWEAAAKRRYRAHRAMR